jgi:hypothetical protein
MATLFAIPKPFKGHIATIQRNAIRSWTLLESHPEIILLGDEEGTAEIAREFNLKHVPEVGRNEYGTPLMNSLFEIAQQEGQSAPFIYVNADIILLSDFARAIQRIPFSRFMLTGQRWNLDVTETLPFEPGWEEHLRDRALKLGKQEGPQAMDYFVFSAHTYTDIPPFAIGRLCWDNWMLYKAMNLKLALIDGTEGIVAIHQNHDYNHHPEGREGVFLGPEAQQNLKLLGGTLHTYFMLDLANWQLTRDGFRRAPWNWERLDRHLSMLPLARPETEQWATPLLQLIRSRNRVPSFFSKLRGVPRRLFRSIGW